MVDIFIFVAGLVPPYTNKSRYGEWRLDTRAGSLIPITSNPPRNQWFEAFAPWSESTLPPNIVAKVQPALDLIGQAPAGSRVARISELLDRYPGRITFLDFIDPALTGVYDPVSRRIELDSGLWLADTETIAAVLVRLGSKMLDHSDGVFGARPTTCLDYEARAVRAQLDFWTPRAAPAGTTEDELRRRLDELVALRADAPTAYIAQMRDEHTAVCADLPFGDLPWERPGDAR